MKIGWIATTALFACLAGPALAQTNVATGLGGAKEQMLPTASGADRRLDDEAIRSRQPLMQAIQAQPPAWIEGAPAMAPVYGAPPYAGPY